MSDKILYAVFGDDEVALNAAKKVTSEGVHVSDVYSPFPIHGIDPVIGLKRTRIAIAAFIYGTLGTILALAGMYYFMIVDWPMDFAGKPNFTFVDNVTSFIPITFEFSVLLAAHGMAVTFLFRNWTFPFMKAHNPIPESTDDKFVIEFRASENAKSLDEIKAMVEASGVERIIEQEA